MTHFITSCTHCQKSVKLSIEHVGKSVRCPGCKQVFRVGAVKLTSQNSSSSALDALATQSESTSVNAAANDPLSASSKKIGRYEVVSKLGRGAFGDVWCALDPKLKRQVALKVFRNVVQANELERFYREARAAAKLRHPGIVAVFEADTFQGHPFIVSELVKGKTLASHIEAGSMQAHKVAETVRDLALALNYAHANGVVHRDVKPANILINENGRPQIADFGLAVDRSDEQQASEGAYSRAGTLAYMAPEQAGVHAASVGPASDQYALGVTMFEMLTGKRPRTGSSLEILNALRSSSVPDVRSVNKKIPKELASVCAKAMAHDPWNRYENCEELANDLERFLGGELLQAHRAGPVKRTRHYLAKHPKIVPYAIAFSAMLLCGMLLSVIALFKGQFLVRYVPVESATIANANANTEPTMEQATVPDAVVPVPSIDVPTPPSSPSEPSGPRQTIEMVCPLFGPNPSRGWVEWQTVIKSSQQYPNTRFWLIVGAFQGDKQEFLRLLRPYIAAQYQTSITGSEKRTAKDKTATASPSNNLSAAFTNFGLIGYISLFDEKGPKDVSRIDAEAIAWSDQDRPFVRGVFLDNFERYGKAERRVLYERLKNRFGKDFVVIAPFGIPMPAAGAVDPFSTVRDADFLLIQKSNFIDLNGVKQRVEIGKKVNLGTRSGVFWYSVDNDNLATSAHQLINSGVDFFYLSDLSKDVNPADSQFWYDKPLPIPAYWNELCEIVDKHNTAILKSTTSIQ